MVMVINKRIKRVLLENKGQYIGSVLLIVLSCLLFTAMTIAGENMQQLTNEFENRFVQEDAAFTADKSIGDLQELEAAGDAMIEEGKTFDYEIANGKTLRIFSRNDKINLPAVIEGKQLSGSDILLSPAFASAHNYKIGDSITIYDKSFKIAGFVALPNYIYPLKAETDLMYSPQNFGIAVMGMEDFNAFNKGSSFYAVKFNHADRNPRAQSAKFRELLKSHGIGILQWTDISDNKRVSSVTLKIDTIKLMSRIEPIAVLLLTSILVSTVIRRMISRESTIIGAMYALGYRRKEIYRHYMIFSFALAIVGGIIGTILGMLSVQAILMVLLSAFTMPQTGISFNPLLIIISLLLPILFLGCSSFLIIRKELKHSPVELMKGDKEKSRVNFLERVLRLEKLKFTAKFKIREQLRSLSRLAFLLVGCIFATVLMLYGFTIKSSLDYFSTSSLEGTFHFQYEYNFKSLQFEKPQTDAEPFSASLFLQEGGEGKDFYVCGVMKDSRLFTLKDESGKPLSMNQVSITKPLADKLKVRKGDTVNIVRKLDQHAFSVKIDSIADSYVGKYIFMPLEVYNDKFEMPEGSYTGLWSTRQLDIPEDHLYSKKSIDESVSAIKESTAPIQALIAVYSVLAFIIGMIVIYLVTSMIIEENRNSISLLKIFGYRKKEVNSLILNSSTIVVVLGYIIGIPLILASMEGLLRSLDNSAGLTLPVKINPLYILIGFIVVMATYELSKLMCRKKVNAIPMSEALKSGLE